MVPAIAAAPSDAADTAIGNSRMASASAVIMTVRTIRIQTWISCALYSTEREGQRISGIEATRLKDAAVRQAVRREHTVRNRVDADAGATDGGMRPTVSVQLGIVPMAVHHDVRPCIVARE